MVWFFLHVCFMLHRPDFIAFLKSFSLTAPLQRVLRCFIRMYDLLWSRITITISHLISENYSFYICFIRLTAPVTSKPPGRLLCWWECLLFSAAGPGKRKRGGTLLLLQRTCTSEDGLYRLAACFVCPHGWWREKKKVLYSIKYILVDLEVEG
jgi:hypothetical protein